MSFPYLDIQLLWEEMGHLNFNVYQKPGKLVKYLNTTSHHNKNHKAAVLSGIESCLALLITVTADNEHLSMSDIYPNKHESLSVAGQLKPDQKMISLHDILKDDSQSKPFRLEKQDLAINKQDSFFIVKYVHLSMNHMPINQIICHLRNEFQLKWLRPRVTFSQHSNLQEKLLGDLKQKLLCGITNANLGTRPCNCPNKYKVNKKCPYGGNKSSCCTAGTIFKIACKAQNCNCFYISKSLRYVKTRVQGHVGEVT